MTGALHVLWLQLSPPLPSSWAPNKIQNGDILVPGLPNSTWKMTVKRASSCCYKTYCELIHVFSAIFTRSVLYCVKTVKIVLRVRRHNRWTLSMQQTLALSCSMKAPSQTAGALRVIDCQQMCTHPRRYVEVSMQDICHILQAEVSRKHQTIIKNFCKLLHTAATFITKFQLAFHITAKFHDNSASFLHSVAVLKYVWACWVKIPFITARTATV